MSTPRTPYPARTRDAHGRFTMPFGLAEGFWRRVDRSGGENACWPWLGGQCQRHYGKYTHQDGRCEQAHRVAYKLAVGPIPPGFVIDHVKARGCSDILCCNPRHLEPVTNVTNVMRGSSPPAINAARTHCSNGHPFTAENTHVTRRGTRTVRKCRACDRDYQRIKKARLVEARTA